jgi:hypothetical protein
MPTNPQKSHVQTAARIIDDIELNNDANKAPFRVRTEELMGQAWQADSALGIDATAEAKCVRQIRGGVALELAARRTGFILGFEYCRNLFVSKDGGAQ